MSKTTKRQLQESLDDANAEVSWVWSGASSEPVPENAWPTPGQLWTRLLREGSEERLRTLGRYIDAAAELSYLAPKYLDERLRADRAESRAEAHEGGCVECGSGLTPRPPQRFCSLSCAALNKNRSRREQVIGDAEWLLETEPPNAIARRLGYANPANLGRVLRRWGRADLARTFERAS